MEESASVIDIPFEEDDLQEEEVTYLTYKLDLDHRRIVGMVDGEEAVKQAIWKTLNTVRFAHLIYDDQYGCDIMNRINDSDLTPEYLESDIPAMVEEALLQDERILGISDLEYQILSGDSVQISFTVDTIYGEIEAEGVIKDDS